MNTSIFAKKFIFLALFLALAFPSVAPAQTFSVEQESQIKAVIQQITDLQIQILLARIAELQTQIAELLAKQVTTEQKVETVIQQTAPVAPVLGSVPTPVLVSTISIGEPICYDSHAGKGVDSIRMVARVPVTITGSYVSGIAKTKYISGVHKLENNGWSGILFSPQSQVGDMPFHNLDEGTYDYTITLSGDFGSVESSGTFSVPVCKL